MKAEVEEVEELEELGLHELSEQESEPVNKPDEFMPNAAIASPTSSPASPAGSDAVEPPASPAPPTAEAAPEQQQDWGWALRRPNFKGRDRLCGTFVRLDDGFSMQSNKQHHPHQSNS